MPRPQKKTNCGICHEYKGIYVRIQIEGTNYWACLECLEDCKPDKLKQRQ
jgi:hypothetical protein